MYTQITRSGKNPIQLSNPVMLASGMMGFEPSTYRNLIKLEKFGAMITTPISWKQRGTARGTRIVERPAGFLFHTGLPNPGMRKSIRNYKEGWAKSPIPIIVHLIDHHEDDLYSCAQQLEGLENITGIELGLREDIDPDHMARLIDAVHSATQLPLLVKLPLYNASWLAPIAEEVGADALVLASPPRGTDRDVATGQFVGGRMYGTYLKPLTLRELGQIAPHINIPLIACGGIHSADDARDFIDAGATAVQIDTLLWVAPNEAEIVARNLGGEEFTRRIGAFEDEWEPGFGKTALMKRQSPETMPDPTKPEAPPPPPELPLGDNDMTQPTDGSDWF